MNRKLLYVLMSAGHRHKFVRTNDEVHTCTMCGRIEPHHFEPSVSELICRQCRACSATFPHEFNASGTCTVCGYVRPADLVSAEILLEGGGQFDVRVKISWNFSAGASPVGNVVITGSYSYSFLEVYSPEKWFTYASYEFPQKTFPVDGSGTWVTLDEKMGWGEYTNKVNVLFNISYPTRNQTVTIEKEIIVQPWKFEV